MVTNDGKYRLKRTERAADLLTDNRVPFQHLALGRREGAGLEEDGLRHGNLPEVVEIPTSPQGSQVIQVQTEDSTDGLRASG